MDNYFTDIIKKYENFNESERLIINRSKKVEFINSIYYIEELINKENLNILDCSAGSGIYSLYLTKNFNCNVTATDIVEKYIKEIEINKEKENLKGTLTTSIKNAIDLSYFESETFDIVLCMGAYYHLIDDNRRKRCLNECKRVLKNGGYLVITYLPINFILEYFSLNMDEKLDFDAINSIMKNQYIQHTDYYCQFTDIRYDKTNELEKNIRELSMKIEKHIGIDGDSIHHKSELESMNEDDYVKYCELIRKIYAEQNSIGMSNHAMIIARK